ncbi:ubiquinone biosynthesis protein COQ9 [Durotheca rogersii]|uniref:ubiquinone biosynthesis protein COQ9 n=1 Tax=Durotheca rogersii TaxID=419775 RepID=UPI00221FC03E|nr:ubiquinone biosynthesis protein COQ9 [Durotheca rogersii]KAI5857285.1 ubiquinone biosynthesis protein COQ9 [Durotheca rogersii]
MIPSPPAAMLSAALRQVGGQRLVYNRCGFRFNPWVCCSYHSYDHPPTPGVFSEPEKAILSAAYRHVPKHGFTQHALSLGARDAGYLDISTNILPEGPFSLIRYHLVTQREAIAPLSRAIYGTEGRDSLLLDVPAKVERLTWERLLANRYVNNRWQEALAVMSLPSHIPTSLRELALLVDEIYFLAGDTSVDPLWYTKRGSLSIIYASSELFMTNDRSAGFSETRSFLQRRLDETTRMRGTWNSVSQWVGFNATAGINLLRSKGLNI